MRYVSLPLLLLAVSFRLSFSLSHTFFADQSIPLNDFFRSTQGKFRTPLVQSWVQELTSQRTARLEDESSTS